MVYININIKNIGKLKNADIELNGITVIAGENNTGKSTVGKVLHSVVTSLNDIEKQIYNQRTNSIQNILKLFSNLNNNKFTDTFIQKLTKEIIEMNTTQDLDVNIKNYIKNQDIVIEDYNILTPIITQIIEILNIPNYFLAHIIVKNKLNIEFENEISNIFVDDKGSIQLNVKNNSYQIKIDEDIPKSEKIMSLYFKSIYIDSPFILDETIISLHEKLIHITGDNKTDLKTMLLAKRNDNQIDNIIIEKKLSNIIDKINVVCSGKLDFNSKKHDLANYIFDNKNQSINVRNLSTGIKSFAIIKTLLLNGSITENSIIILDEPEVHLHPEWQLLFAEIIVLIQKEFNLHILLTTHSPYFMRAIEVYSQKYNILEKNKYYLSENNGNIAIINDVTNDVELIYQKLTQPLQNLEDLRCCDD